jgi:imidazole glycerol-phosphate synthase subunit HisF
MNNIRIVAKLDVKPPNVVKPVHFDGFRKMGTPLDLTEKYYAQGIDEIMYIDIVSSLYQREIQYDEIQKASEGLFVPFGVGGGVRTIEDFSKLFHIGADKVLINTYAIQKNADIINQASKIFGNQAVVVNIEAKQWDTWSECYTDGGRIQTNIDVINWAKEVEQRGAGEILLQSVDHDGRKKGFNLELAKQVVDSVNIPVVIASGAGKKEDIKTLIEYAGPSGVAIASLLHYDINTVKELKDYLRFSGIEVSK